MDPLQEQLQRLQAAAAGQLKDPAATAGPSTPEASTYLSMLQGLRQPQGPVQQDQRGVMSQIIELMMSKGINANRGSFTELAKSPPTAQAWTPAPAGGKKVVAKNAVTNIGESIPERKAQAEASGYPKDYEMNQPRTGYRLTGKTNAEMADSAEPYAGSDDALMALIQQTIGGGGNAQTAPGAGLDPRLVKGMQDFIAAGGDINEIISRVTGQPAPAKAPAPAAPPRSGFVFQR